MTSANGYFNCAILMLYISTGGKCIMGLFDRPEVVILKESSDAKTYLEKLLKLQTEVNSGTELYKKIDKEIAIVRAGIIGEDNILFELKNSGMDLVVIHDVCLIDPNGNSAQIDFVVLTPYVIVFIECKNLFGDIVINNKGDFIRTIEYAGHKYKEGIYSPITQNERHMLVYKNCRSAEKNLVMRLGFEHWFNDYHKSLVVLANPKTVVNDKFAPKDVKLKVIRADQLIKTLKELKSDNKTSKQTNIELGNKILSLNHEERKDYIEKFKELKDAVEKEEAEIKVDVPSTDNNPQFDTTAEKICPRCGNKLVLRTAKRGANQGNQFWGCSSYPKCKYIENI